MCGALLGDAIAWSHQRDGLICQDLVPIEGHESKMLGSGSELELVWHTEDARYAYRGDYRGLMCLRNPDAVPTTFALIDEVRLEPDQVEVLFEPRFLFRPDPSHPSDSDRPEIEEARSAMDSLIRAIDENLTGVALLPGECLFIDNLQGRPREKFLQGEVRWDGSVAQTDKHNEGSKEIARRTRGASIAGGSLREGLVKVLMCT